MNKMTKGEIKTLASDCGYDYCYSGKTKRGFVTKREGTQNEEVDEQKMILFKYVVEENKIDGLNEK